MTPLGVRDVVGADMLGDAARFAGRHPGAADIVEQRGLAVIHMAHDGDHRRARHRFTAATSRRVSSSSSAFSLSSL
jgi:hypothetical protein